MIITAEHINLNFLFVMKLIYWIQIDQFFFVSFGSSASNRPRRMKLIKIRSSVAAVIKIREMKKNLYKTKKAVNN